jgi:ABC-2 type transport system ATP-binding protein
MNIALNIKQLTKQYENGTWALKGIDIEIKEGDFYGFLGANGAGKSTTLGIISGLINKTGGKVEVFGVDIDKNHNKAKSFVGIVPQEFNFGIFETPWQIVTNQAGYYGMGVLEAQLKTEELLKVLGLWDKKDKQARSLSGGMKRRLMIARGLVHSPKLLILDEPTAGVDVELRREMWDYLSKLNAQGVTIILTTHYLEEVENMCKNMTILNNGKVVASGSVQEMLQSIDSQVYVIESKSGDVVIEEDVVIDAQNTLNLEIAKIVASGREIVGLRPKNNRIEELYISLSK